MQISNIIKMDDAWINCMSTFFDCYTIFFNVVGNPKEHRNDKQNAEVDLKKKKKH